MQPLNGRAALIPQAFSFNETQTMPLTQYVLVSQPQRVFSEFQQTKNQGQAQYDFTRIGQGQLETNYIPSQCNMDDNKVFIIQSGNGNTLRQLNVLETRETLVKRFKVSEHQEALHSPFQAVPTSAGQTASHQKFTKGLSEFSALAKQSHRIPHPTLTEGSLNSVKSLNPENQSSRRAADDDNESEICPEEDLLIAAGDQLLKEFLCPYEDCKKAYTSKQRMKLHIDSVHLKIATKYFCTQCDDGKGCGFFAYERSTVFAHMRKHTGDKPYECRICKQRFTIAGNRNDHEKRHLQFKPYACQHCGESFYRNYMKDKHEEKCISDGFKRRRQRKEQGKNEAAQGLKNSHLQGERNAGQISSREGGPENLSQMVPSGSTGPQVREEVIRTGFNSSETQNRDQIDEREISTGHVIEQLSKYQSVSQRSEQLAIEGLVLNQSDDSLCNTSSQKDDILKKNQKFSFVVSRDDPMHTFGEISGGEVSINSNIIKKDQIASSSNGSKIAPNHQPNSSVQSVSVRVDNAQGGNQVLGKRKSVQPGWGVRGSKHPIKQLMKSYLQRIDQSKPKEHQPKLSGRNLQSSSKHMKQSPSQNQGPIKLIFNENRKIESAHGGNHHAQLQNDAGQSNAAYIDGQIIQSSGIQAAYYPLGGLRLNNQAILQSDSKIPQYLSQMGEKEQLMQLRHVKQGVDSFQRQNVAFMKNDCQKRNKYSYPVEELFGSQNSINHMKIGVNTLAPYCDSITNKNSEINAEASTIGINKQISFDKPSSRQMNLRDECTKQIQFVEANTLLNNSPVLNINGTQYSSIQLSSEQAFLKSGRYHLNMINNQVSSQSLASRDVESGIPSQIKIRKPDFASTQQQNEILFTQQNIDNSVSPQIEGQLINGQQNLMQENSKCQGERGIMSANKGTGSLIQNLNATRKFIVDQKHTSTEISLNKLQQERNIYQSSLIISNGLKPIDVLPWIQTSKSTEQIAQSALEGSKQGVTFNPALVCQTKRIKNSIHANTLIALNNIVPSEFVAVNESGSQEQEKNIGFMEGLKKKRATLKGGKQRFQREWNLVDCQEEGNNCQNEVHFSFGPSNNSSSDHKLNSPNLSQEGSKPYPKATTTSRPNQMEQIKIIPINQQAVPLSEGKRPLISFIGGNAQSSLSRPNSSATTSSNLDGFIQEDRGAQATQTAQFDTNYADIDISNVLLQGRIAQIISQPSTKITQNNKKSANVILNNGVLQSEVEGIQESKANLQLPSLQTEGFLLHAYSGNNFYHQCDSDFKQHLLTLKEKRSEPTTAALNQQTSNFNSTQISDHSQQILGVQQHEDGVRLKDLIFNAVVKKYRNSMPSL